MTATGDRMDRMARSYDRFASTIVPYYAEMQDCILERLAAADAAPRLVLDLGAGSGILLQQVCDTYPEAQVVWVDRSPAMRAVAEERLAPYASRIHYIEASLQEAWEQRLPAAPDAIVSMSAIHHLDDAEKQALYQRCRRVFAPGGCFWNADEVQAATPEKYQRELREWDTYVTGIIAAGGMDETMAEIWAAWRQRNLMDYRPKRSGDDCHATAASQLAMLRRAGFLAPYEIWRRGVWAIFGGRV